MAGCHKWNWPSGILRNCCTTRFWIWAASNEKICLLRSIRLQYIKTLIKTTEYLLSRNENTTFWVLLIIVICYSSNFVKKIILTLDLTKRLFWSSLFLGGPPIPVTQIYYNFHNGKQNVLNISLIYRTIS